MADGVGEADGLALATGLSTGVTTADADVAEGVALPEVQLVRVMVSVATTATMVAGDLTMASRSQDFQVSMMALWRLVPPTLSDRFDFGPE